MHYIESTFLEASIKLGLAFKKKSNLTILAQLRASC